MIARASLLLGLCVGCAATGGEKPAHQTTNLSTGAHTTAVQQLTQPLLDGSWASGIAIGLVTPTGNETYGLGTEVDAVFEIGSISKVFTSLVLAESLVHGDLQLDAPIDDVLPPNVHAPSKDEHEITLRQLATHTSGLPPIPPGLDSFENPYAEYTRNRLYAYLPTAPLSATPGTHYDYSNLGVGLLGQLLADHTHTDYAALVRARITAPLGMDHTGIATKVSQGHDCDGNAVPPWDFAALAGAGAIRSTVGDLVRLVNAELSPPANDLGAAIKLTQQVQTKEPLLPVGLAWHFDPGPLTSVIWHNGETAGVYTFLAFDVATKNAVIVLANTSQPRIQDLGISLMQTLRGEAVTPLDLPVPAAQPVADATLDTYVGTYVASPSFAITVTREGSRLVAQATNQPRFTLYPSSETEFYLRAVKAKITFQNGALVLDQGGHQTTMPRAAAR